MESGKKNNEKKKESPEHYNGGWRSWKGTGGEYPLHVVAGEEWSTTKCVVVLQKGIAWVYESSQEAGGQDKEGGEKGAERGERKHIGKHVWDACVTGFRSADAKPIGTDNRDGGRWRSGSFLVIRNEVAETGVYNGDGCTQPVSHRGARRGECQECLFVDDELNVLPISAGKQIAGDGGSTGGGWEEAESAARKQRQAELEGVKASVAGAEGGVGELVQKARTVEQAKVLMELADTIREKKLRTTVALTAGRGRGKSATLGLGLAYAISEGYSNIYVTSPSAENLKTLFEFVFVGFDALGYEEHLDYDIVMKSMDEIGDGHKGGSSDQNGKNNLVVRINVFREHRQTIQYVMPQDSHMLSQAELVVIDEAAAIPLPLVSKLLGPYLVFMASTINGYEGTGRSLSLKLIKQLREQRVGGDKTRQLKEERLDEPIRYSMNDGVEKWLNKLLCLQMDDTHMARGGIPHPSKCELFKVNRDKLFSYHPVSERVLQKMVGLMTSSHYKNTPNDIQLMSDAPAHELYVLLAPQQEQQQQQQQQANGGSGSGSGAIQLPEPLVVIQVCLEGQISRKTIMSNLSRGIKSAGDLIPWLVSQQFQDSNFASLSGARIVRIATHPDYCGMGYGSRALSLLYDFYSFKFVSLSDTPSVNSSEPLFASLSQIKPPTTTVTNAARVRIGADGNGNGDGQTEQPLIRWVGTSFGLTNQLFKFWTSKNLQYRPIYLRQTKSDLTGEHTVVMLKTLNESDDWLSLFCADFLTRFLTLLSYDFSAFDPLLALRIHQSTSPSLSLINSSSSRPFVLGDYFSPYDLKRLESYSNNILDYHVITDLFPTLAHLYFSNKLAALPDPISLSGTQQAVLLAFGLQHSPVELIASKLNCSESVVLALLLKIIKKFVTFFNSLLANESLNNTTTTTTTSTTSNSTTTSSITESSNTSGPTLGSNTIVSLKQSPTTQPQPSSTKDSKSVSQSLLESENKRKISSKKHVKMSKKTRIS